MRRSYLDYAMSVIVSRALPDARDGLKPVHRRILFAMQEAGYTADKAYRKSARVVGEVMGKYHPHGDSAIYDAMVRMAQPFSMRVRLVDGQGNFGSVDGDPPAAMRYTEVRLAKAAGFLLSDIDRDTVDFQANYDESEHEPKVLPASYPNLLINGAGGIAVGMATNIPPHNPGEIIDAALALIENPDMSLEDLMKIVPGPDFPTGGIILGRSGIRSGFENGRGGLIIRARTEFEEIRKDRTAIIVTELPYQVNKATLMERIADLVRNKLIEGIGEIRDESDRSGMRMVIEIKRDANPDVVLNHLFRFTSMQTSFGMNMLALDSGRPRLMGLKEMLQVFIRFREDVILRRATFDLGKARERAHTLVGLAIAVANIDEVIAVIRASPDAASARVALMSRDWPAADVRPLLELIEDERNMVTEAGTVRLTEEQARAILDIRLQRLTGLEQEKIRGEMGEVAAKIADLLAIIGSQVRRFEVMQAELLTVRAEIATPRMTEIVEGGADQDDESLIDPAQMVVTITRDGFIKRTSLDIFRQQNRGGRGRSGAGTRGDDIVTRSFNAHTHQFVLFFSSGGKAYREKVWRLPEGSPTSKGRALVNMLPDLGGDGITAVLPLPQDESLWENLHLVFGTKSGGIRRNRLSDFKNVRSSGLIAMKLDEGDSLIGVATCREGDDLMLATKLGRTLRCQITEDSVRVFAGRDSSGVRGIKLGKADEVISLSVLRHVDVSNEERYAYTKIANQRRKAAGEEDELLPLVDSTEEIEVDIALSPERVAELEAAEEILLTVTDQGFGKRSSAFEYRVMGRGGQGVAGITLTSRTGQAVAGTFPVRAGDGVMMVTDAGRLIRVPSDQVRITGRTSMGVTLFRLDSDERVTSVFPVLEDDTSDEIPAAEPTPEDSGTPGDSGTPEDSGTVEETNE